eukprot:UN14051
MSKYAKYSLFLKILYKVIFFPEILLFSYKPNVSRLIRIDRVKKRNMNKEYLYLIQK